MYVKGLCIWEHGARVVRTTGSSKRDQHSVDIFVAGVTDALEANV